MNITILSTHSHRLMKFESEVKDNSDIFEQCWT